jgi:hypothetical protein
MVRARIWLRCAAVGDQITPIVVKPAVIGWEGKTRRIDLTIERSFNGEELLKRMKGWITVDPQKVIEVVKRYGVLKVLDERDLVVECERMEDLESLKDALAAEFGGEIELEIIKK